MSAVRTGFPENSIFYGRDIKARVHVDWGTFSLVAALKELITSALEDRLNQKFMLISESGIPLYPGETMWVELMVEEKSRINACELGVSRLSSPAPLDPACTGSLQVGAPKCLLSGSPPFFFAFQSDP